MSQDTRTTLADLIGDLGAAEREHRDATSDATRANDRLEQAKKRSAAARKALDMFVSEQVERSLAE